MTIRILLLILFCSSIFVFESFSQVFQEKLNRVFLSHKIDLKKNAKHVSHREYYDVSKMLRFNLELLQYKQNSSYANIEYHFNKDGALTSIEHENTTRSGKTGKYINRLEKFHRTYNSNGHLINRSIFTSDTLISSVDLEYKYDDENRIIEIIRSRNPSFRKYRNLEEIEYFEDGRRSTIYVVTDSSKTFSEEYNYDLNNLLISKTSQQDNLNNGWNFRSDFFYSENENLESKVSFWYNPKKSIKMGLRNGTYSEYNYNEKGILAKIIKYELKIIGEEQYVKGAYSGRTIYKEKQKGNYIFQKIKHKRNNQQAKFGTKVILDHNRNVILEYRITGKSSTLEINNITYY